VFEINQIFTVKLIAIIVGIFIFSSFGGYYFFEENTSKNFEEQYEMFYSFWIFLSSVFLILLSIVIFTVKSHLNKLERDIQALTHYIDRVSKKEYETSLQIKYYSELLHISVLLKNLVKRVNKKEKKKK